MHKKLKHWLGIIGISLPAIWVAGGHILSLFGSGAIIFKYGWKFIPYHIVTMSLFSSMVLTFRALIKRRWPKIDARLTFDPKRLEKPVWVRIRKWGILPTTSTIAFFIGPIYAALFLQFVQIVGRRAWAYALASNAVVTVTLYLAWTYFRVPIEAHFGHWHWLHRLLH